ncbi:hypothetical protein HMPREF1548_06649 [Clostridium sp. KLE 1755]|nr:hypothetical protein HMPREF1548_06649 [Clostridium sp. KLE 1755]
MPLICLTFLFPPFFYVRVVCLCDYNSRNKVKLLFTKTAR